MLKKATCFLISDRGREVDSGDDVKAKAVGTTREFFSIIGVRRGADAQTFVYYKRKEYNQ
jgi:hypothetical protein